jgi:undecaprenyl-diphosphatase
MLMLVGVSGGDALAPVDREAREAGRDLAQAGGRAPASIVTTLGAVPVAGAVVLVGSVVLAIWRRPGAALALVLAFVVAVLVTGLIKAGVERARPPGASVALTSASFPSGHAAHATAYGAVAVALAASVASRRGRSAIVAAGLAVTLAVGLTRVLLGAHYLSDVFGGWALGAVCFGVAAVTVLSIGAMRNTERVSGAPPPPNHHTAP